MPSRREILKSIGATLLAGTAMGRCLAACAKDLVSDGRWASPMDRYRLLKRRKEQQMWEAAVKRMEHSLWGGP